MALPSNYKQIAVGGQGSATPLQGGGGGSGGGSRSRSSGGGGGGDRNKDQTLDDPQKVRVIKKLITNIAEIIYQATFKGKSTTKPAQSVSVSLALFRGRG